MLSDPNSSNRFGAITPTVVFRTSGGEQVGFGHVRRCLTLAGELLRLGARCTFVLDGDAATVQHVAARGFAVRYLSQGQDPAATVDEARLQSARAIVADSYSLQTPYFNALAESGAAIVALDDLADRALPADLVINGSVGSERLAYQGGLPSTRYLLGVRYVLLRSEFGQKPAREIAEHVGHVLVSIGGSDPRHLTPRIVGWTLATLPSARVDVIIGPLFGQDNALEDLGLEHRTRLVLHRDPPHVRELMLAADVAVCGGGQTIYELAATATPAIAVQVADNQAGNLAGLEAAGTLLCAGAAPDRNLHSRFKRHLAELAGDRSKRAAMAQRGPGLIDGLGTVRVAQAIIDLARKAPG